MEGGKGLGAGEGMGRGRDGMGRELVVSQDTLLMQSYNCSNRVLLKYENRGSMEILGRSRHAIFSAFIGVRLIVMSG